jgi:hypothetical protein
MNADTECEPSFLIRTFRAWLSGWCLIGRGLVAILEVFFSLILMGALFSAGRYVLSGNPKWSALFEGAFTIFLWLIYFPITIHSIVNSARAFPKDPQSN